MFADKHAYPLPEGSLKTWIIVILLTRLYKCVIDLVRDNHVSSAFQPIRFELVPKI